MSTVVVRPQIYTHILLISNIWHTQKVYIVHTLQTAQSLQLPNVFYANWFINVLNQHFSKESIYKWADSATKKKKKKVLQMSWLSISQHRKSIYKWDDSPIISNHLQIELTQHFLEEIICTHSHKHTHTHTPLPPPPPPPTHAHTHTHTHL